MFHCVALCSHPSYLVSIPRSSNLAVDTVIKAPCWTEVAASRDWNLFYQVSGPAHTVQSSQRRQPSPRPALRQPGTGPCHLATEITNRSRIALKGHMTCPVSLSQVGLGVKQRAPACLGSLSPCLDRMMTVSNLKCLASTKS